MVGKTPVIDENGFSTKHSNGTESPIPLLIIIGSADKKGSLIHFFKMLDAHAGVCFLCFPNFKTKNDTEFYDALSGVAKMPVNRIGKKQVFAGNQIYIAPYKTIIAAQNNKLTLQRAAAGASIENIDHSIMSLSSIFKENTIGIFLADGEISGINGLVAIKANGGITFAENKLSNTSRIKTHSDDLKWIDSVLPINKLTAAINSIADNLSPANIARSIEKEAAVLEKVFFHLHNKKGVDFSLYKPTTIQRRIARRIIVNHMSSIDTYLKLLRKDDKETDALYDDLLISVTAFFRDPIVYQALTDKILPTFLHNRQNNEPLRIWIPACATGEEVVSFAITIMEFLGSRAVRTPVQIFGTDLSERVIKKARTGIYSKVALQTVSKQRLKKFFTKLDGHYQVIKPIRDLCIFATHNLLTDPPFSKMTVVSCQNLLIYLETSPQTKLMQSFHYALKAGGFLLLGKSESIGNNTNLFEQADTKNKIYIRKQTKTPFHINFFANVPADVPKLQAAKALIPISPRENELEKEADKILLNKYVPAAFLVNKDLEIIKFRGPVARYIAPSSGKASLHILKMIREELSFDLRTILQRLKTTDKITRKEGILLNINKAEVLVTIETSVVKSRSAEINYLIVLTETSSAISKNDKSKRGSKGDAETASIINKLESQLKESHENARFLSEDFEVTKEELQAANEEILSSNEELQSINEELETSKEELQSTNEELITINEELQLRNLDLKDADEYSHAIIETIHESLLMMTHDLIVRNANKGFYQSFRVTPEETEGYNLFDLGNSQWDIPELRKQLKLLQNSNLPFLNFEVTHDFPDIGIKSMLLNAQSFRLKDDSQQMILLAIQDITDRKQMEMSLIENEERLRLLVQNASDVITVFDKNGNIIYESPAAELILGFTTEERIGKNIHTDAIVHPDDTVTIIGLLKKSIDSPKANIYGEFRLRRKDGSYRTIEAIFRNLLDNAKIKGVIANYRDISERKQLENQKDEFIGIASHELKTPVTSLKAYAQILEDVFIKAKDENSSLLLNKMNKQIDRLGTLIVDLLDFTRIEGGKLKFRAEEFDLNVLISEVTEEMQRTTIKHQIDLNLGPAVILNADRYRTGQVLINLLGNAIKYSPDSKNISILSKLDKDKIVVTVTDFGIGIDQNQLDKIFHRFFRVTENSFNAFSGLGLGLYIAGEFIRRQNGSIWVTSEKGKGSSFNFSLPIFKKAV